MHSLLRQNFRPQEKSEVDGPQFPSFTFFPNKWKALRSVSQLRVFARVIRASRSYKLGQHRSIPAACRSNPRSGCERTHMYSIRSHQLRSTYQVEDKISRRCAPFAFSMGDFCFTLISREFRGSPASAPWESHGVTAGVPPEFNGGIIVSWKKT